MYYLGGQTVLYYKYMVIRVILFYIQVTIICTVVNVGVLYNIINYYVERII